VSAPASPPVETEGPSLAERRAARRANQTTFNLVLALLASLAIVAFLVAVVVRPEMSPPTVDYRQAGEGAQSVDERFLVPDLPEDWAANRSEVSTDPSDGVVRWETGFLTPGGDFIAVVQGIEANDSWIADQVVDARSDDDIRIGGLDWEVYDRRDVDDPGNHAYMLVTTADAVTVVLYGTATDGEFEQLASAVAEAR
jgi:hypothetical protein